MRAACRILVVPIFIALPMAAGAQISSSLTSIYDYATQSDACRLSDTQFGASSAVCTGYVPGGYGFAAAAADGNLRRVFGQSYLTQQDPSQSLTAQAAAFGLLMSHMSVLGTFALGDQLVFHMQSTRISTFYGAADALQNTFALEIANSNGSIVASEQGGVSLGSPSCCNLFNAARTGTNIDFSVDAASFNGVYDYTLETGVSTAVFGGFVPVGAGGLAQIDANLLGIDAVDANGNVISSAVFDVDGNATLDVNSTPEPSSLALLSSGIALVAVASARRRP